ncbi:cupin domain-containing protein [uncultured Algibacter sp.]|uniref:cupin domain-containing protein n=1 Tax=uncultured Algibacter sp. TaxID=298659 RepID=UPI00261033CF|nr:cupin domain-containing protein [uncultured Algibacter sp.]
MKRSQFLNLFTIAGVVTLVPYKAIANSKLFSRIKEGFMVLAGKDRNDKPLTIFGSDTFTTKVSTKDSNGDMFIFESVRMGKGGPSSHFHYEQDEWWYILEGEFEIIVGNSIYKAKAGDSVFGPRMVPHSFSKTSEGKGKLLITYQPAGKMEECFKLISGGATKNFSKEQWNSFVKKYGFENA